MIMLTVIGIALRLALVLQPEPFWYDEAFSYIVARLPIDRMLIATAGDVHPPAYYMLLHWWLNLWPDTIRMEVAARSLSFVLSLAALFLYLRVLRMFNLTTLQRRSAWIVCLFLPGLVYYAAEARMYALLECYVLASFVLLGGDHYALGKTSKTRALKSITSGGIRDFAEKQQFYNLRWLRARVENCEKATGALSYRMPVLRRAAVHLSRFTRAFAEDATECAIGAAGGICIAGAALSHNAGIVWGGLILAAVYLAGHNLRRVVVAGIVALVGYAVWAPSLLSQLAATGESFWVWPPTISTAAYMQFMALIYSPHLLETGIDCMMMLLVAGITTFGVIQLARRWPVTLILTVGFPVAALLGSYVIGAGFVLHRLFIPGVFFVAIAWSVIITRRDCLVVSAILAGALLFINVQYIISGRSGATYDLVMSELQSAPADIIYGNNSAIIPISLYSGIPAVIMSGYVDPMGSGLTQETLDAMGIQTANLDRLEWDHAWLLSFVTPGSSVEDEQYMLGLASQYGGNMRVKTDSEFYRWELYYMERHSGY